MDKDLDTIKMPRRFHNKSRFGCTGCRMRRVKCDEDQPICGRCVRTRSRCSYPHATSDPRSSTPASTESRRSPSLGAEVYSTSQSHSTFDLLDLTLMHHYATNTCRHLFTGEPQSQVWQRDIPALAASNSILMHGFLAITALHRALEDPARRDLYRTRALHHHGVGLPLFQEMVASATPGKAEVIVAYAILLGMWIYAFPEIAAERSSLDDILGSVEVVRGGRSVFRLYREVIVASPIGVFLIPPHRAPLLGNQVSSIREALLRLQSLVKHTSDEGAVNKLQMFMDRSLAGTDHTRSAASWMASVDDDYWIRLRNHHPRALLVLAYSSLLVRASEHECWWMAGWSERILLACSEVLSPSDKEIVDWNVHEEQIRIGGDRLAKLARSRDGDVGWG